MAPLGTTLPEDEPDWVPDLIRKLLVADLADQLPGESLDEIDEITDTDARRLLARASVLALSENSDHQAIAYEVATRLVELYEDHVPGLVAAADVLLSRIGNFPGRALLRRRYYRQVEELPEAPSRLGLERISREIENSVTGPNEQALHLTDFQWDFFQALQTMPSVSVSAPTSAGKSFVLGLDLIQRLRGERPACVTYVVPTRALIREVTLMVRRNLRDAGIDGVPVRSVPFPIARDDAPNGAVFVLTQERLMSLLHSPEGEQWISALIVDEAQNIQDGARGVILQGAIETVLQKCPEAEVHFAAPLASNPEFLLESFDRSEAGLPLVGTLSPVSQNLILVSEVHRRPTRARFHLLGDGESIDLGERELGIKMRGGPYKQRAALARAVTRDDESTLLFANTPGDAEKLAAALIDDAGVPEAMDAEINELVEFIRAEIHPDYPLIPCLSHGVAFHYGFMPAIVRARVEDLCRDGKLKYICCTSTLLQGVNLPARHIVIENPKKGRMDSMGRADFLNLAGRAGRLLREFHGNVWCIRPSEWQDRAFEGENLSEIRSAMNEAMADGGSIVQRVLENKAADRELDYGEAALGKIYCDFVRGERDLTESQWRTDDNEVILTETARLITQLKVTLPTEILDTNQSVRPDRMQALYERLLQEPEPSSLVPLRPGYTGANDRMGTIIQILQQTLGGVENNSHLFYKWLAVQWIYNTPLKRIIERRLGRLRKIGKDQSLTLSIRELLKTLEDAIRFRLVKYYRAYTSILELVLCERGDEETAAQLEPFHVYLECGASDRVALNLIALGLSRNTALALRNVIQVPEESTPEDCLAQLSVVDISGIDVPKLCRRELRDLLGRQ